MDEARTRQRMQELLTYANFSKVAMALGVKRATVARWSHGLNVTPGRLEQVADLLAPGTTKEPPPEWARAMEDRLRLDLEQNRSLIESLVPVDIRLAAERVIERLEALSPPSDEGPSAPDGGEAPDEARPQVQGHESPPDREPER